MQTLIEDPESGSEGRRQIESTVRTAIGELTAFDEMRAIAVFNRQRVMIHRQLSLSGEDGRGRLIGPGPLHFVNQFFLSFSILPATSLLQSSL
jgi:hypothetical protein